VASSTSVNPAFHLYSSHFHNRGSNLLGSRTGMPRHLLLFHKITSLISPPLSYVGKIPINRYILAATDGLIRFDQFARADMSLVYQTP